MMKEVLQGNLGLRETIQKQSELIDDQNTQIFQIQNENEDLRERLAILEECQNKDSIFEIQRLAQEKKNLEKRLEQVEQKSNNWANFQRRQEDIIKRSTMTNFAKRTILEQQNFDNARPSQPVMRPQTYDDDQEPIRPNMASAVHASLPLQ